MARDNTSDGIACGDDFFFRFTKRDESIHFPADASIASHLDIRIGSGTSGTEKQVWLIVLLFIL